VAKLGYCVEYKREEGVERKTMEKKKNISVN
jgi:hypothetical protein